MSDKPRPTMKMVAEAAGVSAACVSLALRHDRRIPLVTRERIQKIALRLHYRPHPFLSALMSQRQKRGTLTANAPLAFLTSYRSQNHWRRVPMILKMFEAAKDRAFELGYNLEVFWLNESGMSHRRLSDILLSRGIHGVVVAPVPSSRGHLSLKWENLACVALGYSLWKPVLHRICNHQYHTMALALRELRRRGYRRIAVAVNSENNERVDRNWLASFLVHHPEPKMAAEELCFVPTEWKEPVFWDWVRLKKPEVVISPHQETYLWLLNAGFRIPSEIGFVCLDWSEELGGCAGVNQRHDLLGRAAIEVLTAHLQRNERGLPPHPTVTLLEGEWREGTSI